MALPQHYESASVLATAVHVKGSVIPHIICSKLTWFLMLINVGTMACIKTEYFAPSVYHVQIHSHHASLLAGLLTFFMVFYNSKVFTRYERLHELMKDVSDFSQTLIAMVWRTAMSKEVKNHAVRLVLACNFILYFEISPDYSPGAVGNISQQEWQMMISMKLLSESEVQMLQKQVIDCHAMPGHASFVLLHWLMQILTQNLDDGRRVNVFEHRCHLLRDRQADVLGLIELKMPFAYVHLLDFMLTLTMLQKHRQSFPRLTLLRCKYVGIHQPSRREQTVLPNP